MKKIVSQFLVTSAAYLLTISTAMAGSQQGTSTASFLNLGAGARALSMGEAYSAVTDDANSLYWNPAGLTRIKNRSVALMHSAYLDSSFYDYLAYGQKAGPDGAFGLGFQYFSAGNISKTDINGVSSGNFSPHDLSISFGYARLVHGFSIGAAGKYIQSTIVKSASTEAIDFGIQSPSFFDDRMRLSLAVANLGGTMTFDQESETLPVTVRAGSAFTILHQWLISVDGIFPRDTTAAAAFGTEYKWAAASNWSMAARAGYNTRTTGDVNGFTGPSFGFGLEFSRFRFDYGFLPLGDIGVSHVISFGAAF